MWCDEKKGCGERKPQYLYKYEGRSRFTLGSEAVKYSKIIRKYLNDKIIKKLYTETSRWRGWFTLYKTHFTRPFYQYFWIRKIKRIR